MLIVRRTEYTKKTACDVCLVVLADDEQNDARNMLS